MTKTRVLFLFAAVLAVAALAAAQAPARGEVIVRESEVVVAGQAAAGAATAGNTFEFVSSMMHFENRVVRGAPYAADAVSESVQTLADGNRIRRNSTAKVYRDSEGRTRREQTLSVIGPWAPSGEPPQTTFINDPVAGVSYMLDSRTKTARRLPSSGLFTAAVPAPHAGGALDVPGATSVRVFATRKAGEGSTATTTSGPESSTESLGKQTFEGIEADGTRTTTVVPAGQIGNELPIRIVSERWYSSDLQTVVTSRRADPQFGETSYRLQNISRSEQPRSLFEVPPDYTVREAESSPARELRFERR